MVFPLGVVVHLHRGRSGKLLARNTSVGENGTVEEKYVKTFGDELRAELVVVEEGGLIGLPAPTRDIHSGFDELLHEMRHVLYHLSVTLLSGQVVERAGLASGLGVLLLGFKSRVDEVDVVEIHVLWCSVFC